jgi:Zn finger protein HypA/HybF involved in hydrogenase expression
MIVDGFYEELPDNIDFTGNTDIYAVCLECDHEFVVDAEDIWDGCPSCGGNDLDVA